MDASSLSTFTQLIGQLGFPIFVAVYLMIKGSKDSKDTQQSIQAQTQAIDKLATAVEILGRNQK